jgi:FAD/FMN-containing dehydrogenase
MTRTARPRVRLWYARTCLLVVLVVGFLEWNRYSAPPDEAKDCVVHVRPADGDVDALDTSTPYPEWISQRGGTVNDASCLNRTPVYGVVRPTSEDDVRRALAFAREHHLKVSIAGTHHSMGGQASQPGALLLDMRGLDQVAVHPGSSTLTVGAGATWARVVEAAHAEGLSVAAMPSIDVLSVGGTVSVNAHGADFRTGSLASTVRSIRLMGADGAVERVDRVHDPELFAAVVGGYGLFGVILEVELDAVANEMYDADERTIPASDFVDLFEHDLVADESYRMMYAHLSTSPGSFLDEAIVYTYRRRDTDSPAIPPLAHAQDSRVGRLVLNLARHGGIAQRLRWAGEKHVLPRFQKCVKSRNEALPEAEACWVSRNQAMYNDLGLLQNRLTGYTDVLQEYFVPPDQLEGFMDDARSSLRAHDAQLLSASIRAVHPSDVLLNYAAGPRLAVVLYLSQQVTYPANRDMAELTRQLVASALDHGGTFYLPYQQHYSRADLQRAYPALEEFFALKRARDPDLLFMNSLYARYAI